MDKTAQIEQAKDAARFRKLCEVIDADPKSGVVLPKMGYPNEDRMTLTQWLDSEIARTAAPEKK